MCSHSGIGRTSCEGNLVGMGQISPLSDWLTDWMDGWGGACLTILGRVGRVSCEEGCMLSGVLCEIKINQLSIIDFSDIIVRQAGMWWACYSSAGARCWEGGKRTLSCLILLANGWGFDFSLFIMCCGLSHLPSTVERRGEESKNNKWEWNLESSLPALESSIFQIFFVRCRMMSFLFGHWCRCMTSTKWMLLTLSKRQPDSFCKVEVIVGLDNIPPCQYASKQIFVFICFRSALQYILLLVAMWSFLRTLSHHSTITICKISQVMLTFNCACYASRWRARCKNCEVILVDFDGWHSKGELCEGIALVVLRQKQQGLSLKEERRK